MPDLLFQQLSTVQSSLQSPPQTLASSTVLSLTTFITFLTGQTPITTVNPPVTGSHMLVLIFTGTVVVNQLVAGTGLGQFKRSITPVQNIPVILFFDQVSGLYWPLNGT